MKIKMFMFAALAAFVMLAACSDDKGSGEGPVGPAPAVPGEFDIEFSAITEFSALARVSSKTQNAKNRYVMLDFWEVSYLEQELKIDFDANDPDAQNKLAEAVIEWWTIAYPSASMEAIMYQLTGNFSYTGQRPIDLPLTGLTPDSEYLLVAAGVNLNTGELTTNASARKFRTKALPEYEAQNCTFDWEFVDTKPTSVAMNIKPSSDDVPYICYIVSKEDYREMFSGSPVRLKELMMNYISLISDANKMSIPEFVKEFAMTGETNPFILTGMFPGTDYVVFVCGIDNYGRATTDVSVKEVKTVLFDESMASAATIESVGVKLFDGTAASNTFPADYPKEQYYGSYFLQLKPVFSGECQMARALVTDSDLTKLNDNDLLIEIMKRGTAIDLLQQINVPGLSESLGIAYVYMVAETENGEPGNIVRCAPIEIKKSNLSPISELYPAPSASMLSVNPETKVVAAPKTVGAKKVVDVVLP